MDRTYIDAKTKETETLQVTGAGSMTWLGAIVLEIVACIAAYFIVNLLRECAGLWHYEASLQRDLFVYFGSSLDYAQRAAKRFGFWKAVWNLLLAAGFELAAFSFFSKCLCLKEDDNSFSGSILAFGTVLRAAAYVLTFIFDQPSRIHRTVDDWKFKEAYKDIAAYNRTWFLFWLLVCVMLALIIYAFASKRDNLIIVTCLLIVVGLIAVGTYFNNGKTLPDAMWDIAIFVERTGEAIFRR